MITTEKAVLTAEATIDAPVEKVWEFWTNPKHIINWNKASDDWFTPWAEHDLRPGGKFVSRMEARDGTVGFDFEGEYTNVVLYQVIESVLSDGRKVKVEFWPEGTQSTGVIESFEAEETHSLDLQKQGWQAIMDNFKQYVESSDKFERLRFEIEINAPAEKVYQVMLNSDTYSEWTSVFNPSSRMEGSWAKGSKIRFLGTDKDGKVEGMVTSVRENIPNRYVSLEHYGMVSDNQEIVSGPEIQSWAGSQENYFYQEKDGKTKLTVELDSNAEFKVYFSDTYPQALEKLKEICERN
jgi:uncharacterized protein YndB with AHSA1/START domain